LAWSICSSLWSGVLINQPVINYFSSAGITVLELKKSLHKRANPREVTMITARNNLAVSRGRGRRCHGGARNAVCSGSAAQLAPTRGPHHRRYATPINETNRVACRSSLRHRLVSAIYLSWRHCQFISSRNHNQFIKVSGLF
jgi:hypothetical protein